MEFPFGEVLALNERLSRVLIRFKTDVLDDILSILIDTGSPTTRNTDLARLNQNASVSQCSSLQEGGT